MWACLTGRRVLDPAEGNGSISVTLAKAQQESSRGFITEQGFSAVLSHESHNASVKGEKQRKNKFRQKKRAEKREEEMAPI